MNQKIKELEKRVKNLENQVAEATTTLEKTRNIIRLFDGLNHANRVKTISIDQESLSKNSLSQLGKKLFD